MSELLKQKREQLRKMKRDAHRAAMRGRYNWGDFNRSKAIKELEKEIQELKSHE